MNTPSEHSAQEKPFLIVGQGSLQVTEDLYILYGQGQSFAAKTDVGWVVVDAGPGGKVTQSMIESLRQIDAADAPIHALCYSHGHMGYNSGVPQWLAHAEQRGDPPPRRIAQHNLLRRYARYRETQALQHRTFEMQFNRSSGFFANRLTLHDPTETFVQQKTLGSGAQQVVLLHAPSETDDALALWHPAQRVLYGGPSLLDSIPNIGTPFRTLRDTVRWAETLEMLAALKPVKAVREFGPVIEGEQEVQHVLLHTARALRWLRTQVVERMNRGWNEQQVLASMDYPEELFGVSWMRPIYGDPSYIVRDIWRSENGWWDRNPTTLHPADPVLAGRAVLNAITDKAGLIASAQALADQGQWQLALHVIDVLAALQLNETEHTPEVQQARALKADWLRQRAQQTQSYVSRNLYRVSADMIEQGRQAQFGIR